MNRLVVMALCVGCLGVAAHPQAGAAEEKQALQILVETGTQKNSPTVKFTVVNRSKSYQLVQAMSCSWQDNWRTDNKNAQIENDSVCFKNVSWRIILAPGEKYVDPVHPLRLHGTPGKHNVRFGYVRVVTDFTSDQLKQIYQSKEKNSLLFSEAVSSHFTSRKETFWSAPITVEVPKPTVL